MARGLVTLSNRTLMILDICLGVVLATRVIAFPTPSGRLPDAFRTRLPDAFPTTM